MTTSTLRNFRLGLWGLVLAAGLGASWVVLRPAPQSGQGTAEILPTATIGQGDYRLSGSDGLPFTQESLKGGPSLVFFGFTHCPDVCPMTLADIGTWRESLGPQAEGLKTYLITVDPQRDTLDIMAEYVSWVPDVVGVSGTPEEIAKAIAAFKVYVRLGEPDAAGDYTVDHAAYVMVFDGEGQFDQVIGYQEDPARVVEKLSRLLSKSQG